MIENGGDLLALLVLLVIVPLVLYLYVRRSQQLLNEWARSNSLEITQAQYRVFRKGPFCWSARGQTVYRVRVVEKSGLEREGWVRCGSFWGGVMTDKVEVRWDDD